jgi:hypothetical protein
MPPAKPAGTPTRDDDAPKQDRADATAEDTTTPDDAGTSK